MEVQFLQLLGVEVCWNYLDKDDMLMKTLVLCYKEMMIIRAILKCIRGGEVNDPALSKYLK